MFATFATDVWTCTSVANYKTVSNIIQTWQNKKKHRQ